MSPPRFPFTPSFKDPRQPPGHVIYDVRAPVVTEDPILLTGHFQRYTNFRARSPSPDALSRRILPSYPRDIPSSSHLPTYQREEFQPPSTYRPNVYRPDWDYYHAPDHYEAPPEPFVRDRSASWSSSGKPSSRVDRRSSMGASTSHYVPPRRDADMLASRMAPSRLFEPSDAWKQTHEDNRFIPRQSFGGDKYRPAIVDRDGFPRGRANVYRPRYDDARLPRNADPHRRNSGSRYTVSPQRSRSRSRSISSTSRSAISPSRSHVITSRSPSPFRRHALSRRSSEKRSRSRSSSAFSLASSRQSVPPPNAPSPAAKTPSIPQSEAGKSEQLRPKTEPDMGGSEGNLLAPYLSPISRDNPPNQLVDVVPAKEPVLSLASPDPPEAEMTVPQPSAFIVTPLTLTTTVSEDHSVDPPAASPASRIIAPSPTISPTKVDIEMSSPLTSISSGGKLPLPPPQPLDLEPDVVADMQIPERVDLLPKDEAMAPVMPTEARASEEPTEPTVPSHGASATDLPSTEPLSTPTDSTPALPPINRTQTFPTPPPPSVATPPTAEDIPIQTEADSMKDVLRIVVMTRMVCDSQTRAERVNPILDANHALPRYEVPAREEITAADLVSEMQSGDSLKRRFDMFERCKPSLVKRFEDRQAMLLAKVERLRGEYIELHEKWLVHCTALDEQNKPSETETAQPTGRTTRRTANLGDAVRSDLEMEQIIASLGNDDATDPAHLSQKNLAVIPDMISVTNGQVDYAFDDTNHLVTDPHEYYAPRTGMNDWTPEEKFVFCDKFAAHPKQFGIIADSLPNKTPSQCVSFYYLHKKKFIDFRKVISQLAPNKRRRKRTDKQKGNALLTDIRRHDAEVNRGDSPASAPTGRASRRKTATSTPQPSEPSASTGSRRQPRRSAVQHLEATPASTPTPEPEVRTRRRRTNNTPLAASSSVDDVAQAPVSVSAPMPVPASAPAPSTTVTATPTPVPTPVSTPVPTPSVTVEEEVVVDPEQQRPAKKAKRSRKVVKSAAIVSDDVIMDDAASDPSTRPQSTTPFQIPTLSEEQQKVVLGLLADFMNPAVKSFTQAAANSSQSSTPDVYGARSYPTVIAPPVGSVRYGDIAMSRPAPSRPSEPPYPGAGIMSPVMSPAATITPVHPQPNTIRFANEQYNAPSSRTSFHANPWVPFQSGSTPLMAQQQQVPPPPPPPVPSVSFMPVLPPGGGRLDSPFTRVRGPPVHPPEPRHPGAGLPLPHPRVDSPLSLPPFTPTSLPLSTPGPSTSLERNETRIYRTSGQFVPMTLTMSPPLPSNGIPSPRGQNPYPVIPPPYSTSYNLPR